MTMAVSHLSVGIWLEPLRRLFDHKLCSKYMLDIVRGVGHLHNSSMVHADLSMNNLEPLRRSLRHTSVFLDLVEQYSKHYYYDNYHYN